MFQTPRFSVPSRVTSRGGFTLVELLVVIGIIAILAGVALGPITSGIKKAKQSTSMQNARSIGLLCFQFSVDNDSIYPSGATGAGTAQDVAIQLLQGKYATDPTIFYEPGASTTKAKYGTTGYTAQADFANFGAANISWDFTVVSAAGVYTGVSSSASDLLPVVFGSPGTVVNYLAAVDTGLDLPLTATCQPFGTDGIPVAYKSNSAVFINGTLSGAASKAKGFISPAYADSSTYLNLEPK